MPQRRARNQTTHVMWSESSYRPAPKPDPLVETILSGPARPLVAAELRHLSDLGYNPSDPDVMERAIGAGVRRHVLKEIAEQEAAERTEAQPAARRHVPIVYYMRMGGLVKIGTTTHLAGRYTAIYPEEVMAVELGDATVERRRHEQFQALYSHGEWFTLDDRLRAHIDAVGRAFADATGATVQAWLAEQLPPRRRRFSSASMPAPSPDGRAPTASSPSGVSGSDGPP